MIAWRGLGPRFAAVSRTLAVGAVAIAVAVAACGGGSTPVGLASPPAGLDPDSPTLVAEDLAFDHGQLSVPSGEPFVLVLENRDAVGHNVSIYADTAHRNRVVEGVLFTGPATRWYPVPALTPGTYQFLCDLHPTMAGTITAT
jgi:plastocyanin